MNKATRLTTLRLLQRTGETTLYRVNPRFFFAQNPDLAQLAVEPLKPPTSSPMPAPADPAAHPPPTPNAADGSVPCPNARGHTGRTGALAWARVRTGQHRRCSAVLARVTWERVDELPAAASGEAPGMKKVNLWVPDNRLDISALGVEFAGLPVASASVDLVTAGQGT
ncbi:hypothetical protein [Streptomyces sp. McG3]|uniref:hypothetical protein n=1 Tax=Streptomyces sp. McG3 TaxID=2725483 RepID=UPI00203743F4|nr:hypothetical protein [Streptomyces sp. McG3]